MKDDFEGLSSESENQPTMRDAIDAGDGTLHGTIEHLQARALRAERELAAYKQAMTDAQVAMLETIGGIEQRVRELLAANA